MSATHTNLDWQDGQPLSRRYGDVYFSRESGIEETRHVFLHHNDLPDRWHSLPPGAQFVIGETGFGTGLNFLCAWELWEACAPADAVLHFFSVEKHPLSADELAQALSLWPQLARWRDALVAQYRDPPPGWHRFRLNHRVTLTLAVCDVADALPQLDVPVDAWFLDGFAPARNPDMWRAAVLDEIARHAHVGTSFATFTAAGEVRRNLEAAGFAVERVKGYGPKREMLCGVMRTLPNATARKPWYARPLAQRSERRAIVIGGGLAGTSAAASLAARGWEVELLERHAALAAEASGNPQAILYARLSSHATPLRALVVAGYTYTLRVHGAGLHRCGLLQLAFDDAEAERQRGLLQAGFPATLLRAVDRREASAIAGIELPSGGLHFGDGGWFNPALLCRAWAAMPGIDTRYATEALRLERHGGQWRVIGESGFIAEAPVVVIAGAYDSTHLAQTAHLPLKTIRGQLSFPPATDASAALRAVVCGEGYAAPAYEGAHSIGATHKFNDTGTEIRAAEHAENFAMLGRLAPSLHAALHATALDLEHLPGRAALRTSTPDYLPIVGPVVDAGLFNERYAALSRDATLEIGAEAPWLDGLYISAGHGSRGLITAPLAGELITAYVNGEPHPLPTEIVDAIHPSRFLLRDIVRGKTSAAA